MGSNLAKKIVSRPGDDCLQNIKTEQKVMKPKTVESSFMLNAIKQLKNGKAAGPDKLPTTIVKDVGDLDDDSGKRRFIINRRMKTTMKKDILW